MWPFRKKKKAQQKASERKFTEAELAMISHELRNDPMMGAAFGRYNRLREEQLDASPALKGWRKIIGKKN